MRSTMPCPPLPVRDRRGGAWAVALTAMLALAVLAATPEPAAAQRAGGGGANGNGGTGGGTAGGGSAGGGTGNGSTGNGSSGRSDGSHEPAGAIIRPEVGDRRIYLDPLDDPRPRRVVRRARPRERVEEPRIVLPTPGDDRLVAGEVLVELRRGVRIESIATRLRLEIVGSTKLTLTGTVIHRLRTRTGARTADILGRLGRERGVAFAQPDYVHTLQQNTAPATIDTATAPTPLPGQYAGVRLGLPAAHRRASGRGVTVGVIDTAVDQGHPDLGGAVAARFDAIGGGATEPAGHGTAMAGAIAAHGRLTGVAPAARLVVARAFGDPAGAAGSQGTSFHVVGGLDWAITQGARVVSLSFAGPRDALMGRELEAARARGVVAVAAAGNAGPQSPPLYPAAEPGVIAVTACDGDDRIFAGANRGHHITVTAPGVDVLVAAPHGGYDLSTGTSVATAEVAGVVALMLEAHPDLDTAGVLRRLQTSARDLGEPGPDPVFGAGLVDADAALK